MLKVQLKLKLNDGELKSYYPSRKTKIWPILVGNFWESCYIKIIYGNDLYNHGTFTTTKDVKQFVQECTEPELIEYANNWYK